jgi:histidine triad (HIT) family protein
MHSCVFCEIVAGTRGSHLVHETPTTIAFLDQFRQPDGDVGHVLVIPRTHIENIYGVDEVTGAALFASHALLARAIKRAFSPDGITTWSSNEAGAEQEVPHFHLHVYPRRVGVAFPPPRRRPEMPLEDDVLAPAAMRIRRAVGELGGL